MKSQTGGTAAVFAKTKWEIEPRNKWVLIRKLTQEETQTADGVVLPGEGSPLFNARSQRGIVVAAPEGVGLAKGDVVIYTNFPLEIPDIEEFTGERNLHLVLEEEVYARAVPCP